MKSIEEFISAKRKIPDGLDPGELQSIKSYQIEKDYEQKTSEDSEPPKKKPKVKKEIKIEETSEVKKEIKTEETSEIKKEIKIEETSEAEGRKNWNF